MAEGWTQGAFARTARRIQVGPANEKAACWCILGAGNAAFSGYAPDETQWYGTIQDIVLKMPQKWNDEPERTQEEVIAMAKQAEKILGLEKKTTDILSNN